MLDSVHGVFYLGFNTLILFVLLLARTRTALTLCLPPSLPHLTLRVLQTIASSLSDFLPVYGGASGGGGGGGVKERLHSSSLSLLAAAWESYGRRLLALLHSQLQCHTTGGEEEEEEEEAFALSVCLLARHLADQVGGGAHITLTHT